MSFVLHRYIEDDNGNLLTRVDKQGDEKVGFLNSSLDFRDKVLYGRDSRLVLKGDISHNVEKELEIGYPWYTITLQDLRNMRDELEGGVYDSIKRLLDEVRKYAVHGRLDDIYRLLKGMPEITHSDDEDEMPDDSMYDPYEWVDLESYTALVEEVKSIESTLYVKGVKDYNKVKIVYQLT